MFGFVIGNSFQTFVGPVMVVDLSIALLVVLSSVGIDIA